MSPKYKSKGKGKATAVADAVKLDEAEEYKKHVQTPTQDPANLLTLINRLALTE